jgi:hypothetical protein
MLVFRQESIFQKGDNMETIEKVKKLELSISKKEERVKKIKAEIEQQNKEIKDIQNSCNHKYKTVGPNYSLRVCVHCNYSHYDLFE